MRMRDLQIAGVILLLLVNVALFMGGKSDWHDSAVLAGSLVGGLLVQAVLVAIVYGLYRLVRRNQPQNPFLMVAFKTLAVLACHNVLTMVLPEGRNAKVREVPAAAAPSR